MSDMLFPDTPFGQQFRSAANKLTWLGIAMVVLGAAAIIFPIVSTLVATAFVGALLIIAGSLMLAGSFAIVGAGPFFAALVVALLSIGVGAFLVFNPQAGAVGLTLALGIIFILQSAFEIMLAFEIRPFPGWTGMLISGIASLVLAVLIIVTWPGISMIVLGILFGVNFISTGIGYIVVANNLRR